MSKKVLPSRSAQRKRLTAIKIIAVLTGLVAALLLGPLALQANAATTPPVPCGIAAAPDAVSDTPLDAPLDQASAAATDCPTPPVTKPSSGAPSSGAPSSDGPSSSSAVIPSSGTGSTPSPATSGNSGLAFTGAPIEISLGVGALLLIGGLGLLTVTRRRSNH